MCGYHGLRFSTGGDCIHNPHGDQRISAGMVARAYPTAERYGLVWVWMGEKTADIEALPGFATGNPDWLRMQAPWGLVIDSVMDLTHTSFLYDGFLGRPEMAANPMKVERAGIRISVLRHFENQSPPEYYDLMFKREGAPANLWQNAHWVPPSIVIVHNGIYAVGDAPNTAGSRSVNKTIR